MRFFTKLEFRRLLKYFEFSVGIIVFNTISGYEVGMNLLNSIESQIGI